MDDIIKKLLEGNDYKELAPLLNGVHTYQSESYKDVIIVALYVISDLYKFDQCDVTKNVMAAFNTACKISPNALKDTSLVICLESDNVESVSAAQNVILDIEENVFGFRKYVLPYGTASLSQLKTLDSDNLNTVIYEKLREGFDAYELNTVKTGGISEYEVVLNLFVKLPFMKIQGKYRNDDQIPLSDFLATQLKGHSSVLDLVLKTTEAHQREIAVKDETGYDDFDVQVEKLLAESHVQEYLAESLES